MKLSYEELEAQAKQLKIDADCYKKGMEASNARLVQLAAENARMKDALSAVIDRSNEPDYQSIGMGCGVEDNGLQTDGYNACEYGWREAMDRIYSEVIPDAIPETQQTDAFLDEVRASALPVEIAEIIDSGDLEAILFASGHSETERYRMALYNFRTSRKGVQS